MPGAHNPDRKAPSSFEEFIALYQQDRESTFSITWTALNEHSNRLVMRVRKTAFTPWRTWTSDFIAGSITPEQLQGIVHGWTTEAAEQGLFEA
jgi:hypothetical protein